MDGICVSHGKHRRSSHLRGIWSNNPSDRAGNNIRLWHCRQVIGETVTGKLIALPKLTLGDEVLDN